MKLKEMILESSLNRIKSKLGNHDAGAMTAFRGGNSKSDNKGKNSKLLAFLTDKGYSVTKVKGSYIEEYGSDTAKEVGEETFFVVDHKDTGGLKADLQKLGKLYDQDSILWIPKGGSAMLIGTSKREDAFPSFGETHNFSGSEWGKASGMFFSRVKGRQFSFTESVEDKLKMLVIECEYPQTINGIRVMKAYAKEISEALEA